MSDTQLYSIVIVALVGVLAALWARYATRDAVQAAVRGLMPGTKYDEQAAKISMIVYTAVEQRVKAYEAMDSADKLALASKWMAALYKFYSGGRLTAPAREALMEYEVAQRNADKPGAGALGG